MGHLRTTFLICIAALFVVSCGSPEIQAAGDDLLFISARGGGVAVITPGGSGPDFLARNSTPSSNWKTVVKSYWRGNTTKLVALDPATGLHRWEAVVGESQRVKIVSGNGTLVATSPWDERGHLRGRARTTLTVAGSARPEPQRYELEGNFEPEAFSTDGGSLFVVSYLPARKPVNYQVRRLDLTTGEVTGVYTPDAHLQQSMGGTARIQAASPDGTRLYTLYTLQGTKDAEARAFIHVLDLDEKWAHCIELPTGFEASDLETAAITVSKDGKHAYLADSRTEALVEIDTDKLVVSRTGTVELDSAGATHMVASQDGILYAASGVDVVAIDLATLGEKNAWQMFSDIAGLQVGRDPSQLFIGVNDRIIVLDVETGLRLDSIDPEGIRRIGQFGEVQPPIAEEEESFTCAC
ncbi:MAG: hypothetical protein QOG04_1108 [Actinomycetota bacterium]|nr:hypothetical protein [Actinomycetota bacterium]